MKNVVTINFIDTSSGDEGVVIVRAKKDQVVLCLSLKGGGDTEVFLSAIDGAKVLAELQLAVEIAKAE